MAEIANIETETLDAEEAVQAAVADGRQQLGQRLDLGLELAGRKPGLGGSSLLALASAAAACTASSAASVSASILAISAISRWPRSAAALSLEASGARPTISRVCAVERGELALELGDLLLALAPLRLEALAARARFGRGVGELGEPRFGRR